jgi:molybdopterin-guanine dinucleotide biosynthesis protein A
LARADQTLGVVLAGGNSCRFGTDKAAAILNGETLLTRAVKRAAPQVGRVVIAGRSAPMPDIESISDEMPGQGPLAGVLAGLAWAETRGFARIATFPCDVPFFPSDLVKRLAEALADGAADCAMVESSGRKHPVFALWQTASRQALARAFADGLRSLHGVESVLRCAIAAFDEAQDFDPFFNVNRLEDLQVAQQQLDRFHG